MFTTELLSKLNKVTGQEELCQTISEYPPESNYVVRNGSGSKISQYYGTPKQIENFFRIMKKIKANFGWNKYSNKEA